MLCGRLSRAARRRDAPDAHSSRMSCPAFMLPCPLVRPKRPLSASAASRLGRLRDVRRGPCARTMVARFQLVSGLPVPPPAVERWPAEWAAAVPEGLGWSFSRDVQDAGTSATALVAWRLVGANNRELGRSTHAYPDLTACRAAVAFLREHLSEADTLLANVSNTGLWLWRLNIGEQWMAVSGRSYLRRRECQYNLAQFVAEAPTAMFPSAISGRSEARGRLRTDLQLPPSGPPQGSLRQRPLGQSRMSTSPTQAR
jgi:hypothetical protein